MAKNGRQKGNVAEREVAAILQKWWREKEPDCEFIRTPLSGGWSTGSVREHFKAAGDIMTTAKKFPWTVEVKRREGWSLDNLIKCRRSPVWGWWEQTVEAATTEQGWPMLWLRKNRMEWHLLMRIPDMDGVYPLVTIYNSDLLFANHGIDERGRLGLILARNFIPTMG